MARWEPGSGGRLREAAMELFLERGFEQTMVADIAERAGVTARTFFRHFADKREVLFAGSAEMEAQALAALKAADAQAPLDLVAISLDAVAEMVGRDRDFSRRRNTVVAANPELLERELIKLVTLAAALADGLRERGINSIDAALAAEAGVAVYRVAYDEWVKAEEELDLGDVIKDAWARLRTLTAVDEHGQ